MATPPLSDEQCREALRALEQSEGNKQQAAQSLGLAWSTYKHRLGEARRRGLSPDSPANDGLTFPSLPSDEMPTEALIDHLEKRFQKRHEAHQARKWFTVDVNETKPIGICWFGDPHIDDDGCNWPLLKRDVGLVRDTPGLYAANIGDVSNNWSARLSHLWADQDVSKHTARQLIRWLLLDSGMTWLLWLHGNHDAWGDQSALIREMGAHPVWMHDWQAQFQVRFPNKRLCKMWASHDFPGHSMYHGLHGNLKAARMKAEAHLYISGHRHQWALFQDESADREFTFWLARCRGYKYIDHFAEKLGYLPQQEGASIISIIDPCAESMSGFVHCFADVQEGADYLTWKRRRHEKQ